MPFFSRQPLGVSIRTGQQVTPIVPPLAFPVSMLHVRQGGPRAPPLPSLEVERFDRVVCLFFSFFFLSTAGGTNIEWRASTATQEGTGY